MNLRTLRGPWAVLLLCTVGCFRDPDPTTDAGPTDTPGADAVDSSTAVDATDVPAMETAVVDVGPLPVDVPAAVDTGPSCPLDTPDEGVACVPAATSPCMYPGVVCGPGMRHFNTATCTEGRWRVVIPQCPVPDAAAPADAVTPMG